MDLLFIPNAKIFLFQQIEVADAKRGSYFMHRDYGWVALPLLKAADILLSKPCLFGELLLLQPLRQAQPLHVLTNHLPHVHDA